MHIKLFLHLLHTHAHRRRERERGKVVRWHNSLSWVASLAVWQFYWTTIRFYNLLWSSGYINPLYCTSGCSIACTTAKKSVVKSKRLDSYLIQGNDRGVIHTYNTFMIQAVRNNFYFFQSLVWTCWFSTWWTGLWLCTPSATIVAWRTHITMEVTHVWIARNGWWRCGISCNWDNRPVIISWWSGGRIQPSDEF